MKRIRKLTVGYQLRDRQQQGLAEIPFIRLVGKWISEAGFAPGDSIQVEVEPSRLVITRLGQDGSVDTGRDSGEFGFIGDMRHGGRKEQE